MQTSALFTDLYELKMLAAYQQEGMDEEAVFTLFVRRLPPQRNYLLACGLGTVLEYLEHLQFEDEDLAYLHSTKLFSARFLDSLRTLRFQGEVRAVPEGTPLFANEPILEVRAPIAQAQLIETFVMNQIHLQTVLASKAARVVTAAQGRPVVDFGARRMHGTDAALKAARAFHIAGVASTSNVLAGRAYGLPIAGTMAHSYVQAHDDESDALRKFASMFPGTTLLVDTYDTIECVRRVIALARELGDEFDVAAVRLDSGDLAALARETRSLLDTAGLQHVKIFASGGLDEYSIGALMETAPIDAFGVGTNMGISADKPDLDIVYKLAEYRGKGRLKLAADKPVLPGRKQVFRQEQDGFFVRDIIGRAEEDMSARPLMDTFMANGRLIKTLPALDTIRAHARDELARLPEAIRAIAPARTPYAVEISKTLAKHQAALRKELS